MNIFTTLNDAYFPRLMVFARTLRKHNNCPIDLKILYFDLSEKNRSRFMQYSRKLGIHAEMIRVDPERIQHYKLLHHVTAEAYTKLMVLEIYPTEDRALWIDVDTVILGNLEPFYQTDLTDYYVAGAPEDKGKLDIKRLGLSPESCYFNAGVILFNLAKIRSDFDPKTMFEIYGEYEDRIRFADQDIVNIAFSSHVKRDRERKYNYMIRSGHKIGRKELKEIKNNVAVMHFIRHIKPWHYYYQGRARFIYLREMFPLYPLRTIFLVVAGEIYKLKPYKKTLQNSNT